ncbi:hypothetical protein SCHPADRAFT_822855, partial [Schizopora paradoxa]
DNVLLTPSNVPLLADFGLSRMNESFVPKEFYSTETYRGSIRWLAYEYFVHDDKEDFHLNARRAFGPLERHCWDDESDTNRDHPSRSSFMLRNF